MMSNMCSLNLGMYEVQQAEYCQSLAGPMNYSFPVVLTGNAVYFGKPPFSHEFLNCPFFEAKLEWLPQL